MWRRKKCQRSWTSAQNHISHAHARSTQASDAAPFIRATKMRQWNTLVQLLHFDGGYFYSTFLYFRCFFHLIYYVQILITKQCGEYRFYNGVLFIFLMVLLCLSRSTRSSGFWWSFFLRSFFYNRLYNFRGYKERTAIDSIVCFINVINLVRSRSENDRKTKSKKKIINEKESGQAYLILHADTLLILKYAVALCVTGSNYKNWNCALHRVRACAPHSMTYCRKDDSIEMYSQKMHSECLPLPSRSWSSQFFLVFDKKKKKKNS